MWRGCGIIWLVLFGAFAFTPIMAAERNQKQLSLFARMAIQGIQKEYPNKPGHVVNGEKDIRSPRAMHPAFYGSFDWHSSVHSHWMLARLLRWAPELPENREIRAILDRHLTAANLKAEAKYLDEPNRQSFERTYGWAWLLKLGEELHDWDDADGRRWFQNMQPLLKAITARWMAYFPKQTYPIRVGVHQNTAFALALGLDYARAVNNRPLIQLIEERSRFYFAADACVPAAWEPDGTDFLSPSLVEADLMCRILPPAEFRMWLHRFLPDLERGEPKVILFPAKVTDRSDPHLVHLDGLNLSRAWCMRGIASSLPQDDPARQILTAAAARHSDAALRHVASGNYMGEHWLASFAVYLISMPEDGETK